MLILAETVRTMLFILYKITLLAQWQNTEYQITFST